MVMFVISAFRVNIGVDYVGHLNLYNFICWGIYDVSEPLYVALCIFSDYMNVGFPLVVAFLSFITIYPIYRIAKKTENPFVLLYGFLMIYITSFALMRQCAAISLAVYGSYLYLKEGGKKISVIFFLLSIGFHYSLLTYVLVFYLSCYLKLKLKNLIILSFVILLFGVYSTVLLDGFVNFANILSLGYSRYLEDDNKHFVEPKIGTGLGIMLRYVLYALVIYLANRRIKDLNISMKFNTLFFFLFLLDVLSLRIVIFMRLYLAFYPCLFIPFMWVKYVRTDVGKIRITNLILYFIVFSNLLTYSRSVMGWENIPYQTILNTGISVQ